MVFFVTDALVGTLVALLLGALVFGFALKADEVVIAHCAIVTQGDEYLLYAAVVLGGLGVLAYFVPGKEVEQLGNGHVAIGREDEECYLGLCLGAEQCLALQGVDVQQLNIYPLGGDALPVLGRHFAQPGDIL